MPDSGNVKVGSTMKQMEAARWGGGLLGSVFVVNFLCLLFTNSLEPTVWDEAAGRAVPVAGQIHRHRSEGWAETRIGKYGVHGIADIQELRGPKIIFWGDSHVEGLPLDDQDKIAQQFNRLAATKTEFPTAFAVGVGGSTVGTTYRLIPHYERLAPPVVYHFILITRLHFIMPDDDLREPYALRSQPSPGFHQSTPQEPNARNQALLGWLRHHRLPLAYRLYWQTTRLKTRFHLGTVNRASGPGKPPDPPSLAAVWAFLLDRFLERTEVPIAFIYCPSVPRLDRGRVSHLDGNLPLVEEFAAGCRRRGVPFISLHQDFSRLYETSGRFPRGFSNSNPHWGHLNPQGTRLVATKVAAFLSD